MKRYAKRFCYQVEFAAVRVILLMKESLLKSRRGGALRVLNRSTQHRFNERAGSQDVTLDVWHRWRNYPKLQFPDKGKQQTLESQNTRSLGTRTLRPKIWKPTATSRGGRSTAKIASDIESPARQQRRRERAESGSHASGRMQGFLSESWQRVLLGLHS